MKPPSTIEQVPTGQWYDIADECERRSERSPANPGGRHYSECSPSKLIHANGTRMAAQDRELVAVMALLAAAGWFERARASQERIRAEEYGTGEW